MQQVRLTGHEITYLLDNADSNRIEVKLFECNYRSYVCVYARVCVCVCCTRLL